MQTLEALTRDALALGRGEFGPAPLAGRVHGGHAQSGRELARLGSPVGDDRRRGDDEPRPSRLASCAVGRLAGRTRQRTLFPLILNHGKGLDGFSETHIVG